MDEGGKGFEIHSIPTLLHLISVDLGKCPAHRNLVAADGFSWWMGFCGGCY